MNLSCSTRMIKYLMFAFNLFFVISGIIIIAVGATVKTVYSDYSDFLDSKYFSLPNMLIATGALIFFISFFGCCGAIKESWIMLGVFSIFLCIIFIFEFSAGIAGYVLRDKTLSYLETTLKDNLPTYQNSSHAIWDSIQSGFGCCGVDSYKDWKGTFEDPFALPVSCCPAVTGNVGAFYCNTNYGPTTGTTTPSITTSPPETTNTPETTASPTATTVSPSPKTSPTTIAPTTEPVSTTDPSTVSSTSESPAPSPVTSPVTTKIRRRAANETDDKPTTTTTTTTPNPSSSKPYQTGCASAFGSYVKKHAVQIGGCAMALAVIQLLGIVFSCHLVRQLKNGYYST